MNYFGEILTKLRKEKGLTQEDLADIFQVSRQSVSKWETNIAYPETEKLILIAKYFNVSLDSLILPDNNIKLSNAKEIIENELLETNNNNIFDEKKEISQQNIKSYRLFDKKRKRIIVASIMTFFFILVIGISLLINNIGSKTYRIGDMVETASKIKFRVNSVNYPGNIGGYESDSELIYVVIEIEMTNINETTITVTPEQFKYTNKLITQTSNNGSMIFFRNTSFSNQMFFKNEIDGLYGVSLEANSSRKGYLIFASPLEARKNQKLIYTETFDAEGKIKPYAIALPNVS